MLKKELRANFGKERDSLTRESLLNSSLCLANSLLRAPIWDGTYYHLFLPIFEKKEIDTTFILSILQGKDKEIVVPKVSGPSSLAHYLLTDTTKLVKNSWGIPEPADGLTVSPKKIDVVFVPLLAFDRSGNRVGYGKGFYDRFLAECRSETIKVGLSLFEAVEKITDVDENDIPLDYCITPSNLYSFGNS